MQKKKIAIIGIVGLPAKYGGFETMVEYLTKYKSDEVDFTVFCEKTPKDKRLDNYNGARLKYIPFKANGSQSIVYDMIAIFKSWFKYDSLLILGTSGITILPFLRLFKKTKTVVNFGGLEWAREKWPLIGKWYLKYAERIAIKFSTIMVADNQHFCNYIEEKYNVKAKLIEYGGDHVSKHEVASELIKKYPFLAGKYDVSVSRAQADNNLHVVLEAYSNMLDRNLVLVSNYDKFEYGRKLKNRYKEYPNLYLQDAVYNLNELDTIRSNAEVYIHSHSFCGTAPSLVEAMNLGKMIFAYDVETNRFTTEQKAVFFTDANSLVEARERIVNGMVSENGEIMKEIAHKRYTWEIISNKYLELL